MVHVSDTQHATEQLRTKVKQRKKRLSFAPYQVARLKTVFNHRNYLTTKERRQFACELDMKDQQVKAWFQNKRTQLKKRIAQQDEHYTQLLYLNDLISHTSPRHHHDNQVQMSPHGYQSYQVPMQPRIEQSQLGSRDLSNNSFFYV